MNLHPFTLHRVYLDLPCEQALQSALAAGREKEGELATTSLEFEYLHRKNRSEMLIGGNLTVQSTKSHKGIGEGIEIPQT